MVYLALVNKAQEQNKIDRYEQSLKAFNLLITSRENKPDNTIEICINTTDLEQARLVTNLAFDWFNGDLIGWQTQW